MPSASVSEVCRRGAALTAAALVAASVLVAVSLEGGLARHPAAALCLLLVVVVAWLVGSAAAPFAPARALLASLLALRLLGLLAPPSLSDDIHRYVHEGRASRLGIEVPFTTPPLEVTPPPDDGTTAKVNHPDVPAAYPPLSQWFFLVVVAAGDALTAPTAVLRLALALLDALVVLLLFRRRERAPRAFALYGLHPLPLLEASLGSHLDALGVALVVAAVLSARSPLSKGGLVGLACGVKPIALLALLALDVPGRRGRALLLAGALAGVVGPALPYLAVDAPLGRGLVEYGTRWRANPTLFALVETAARPLFAARQARGVYLHAHVTRAPFGLYVEEAGRPLLTFGRARQAERPILLDHSFVARAVCGALLLFALALLIAFVDDRWRRVTWAFGALWLLAPTVHPWYLLWLVPFAALSSSSGWLAFAALAPLSYAEGVWPRAVMLLALAAGTALDVVRARRARPSASRAPAP